MQQGNFINVFLARHVSGTYAHHLKTTTHPKTWVCKNLFINSTEKYFNHTTHPLPLSNLPPH